MSFESQSFIPVFHKEEKVHLVVRKHWLIPLIRIIFWLFLIGIFMASNLFFADQVEYFQESGPGTFLDILTEIFILTALLGLLMTWVLYYLNVQLLTSRRIIDVNQRSLIHHETTELDLRNVQDVTTEIKGALANLFGYGNVQVQTAGTEQNFIFDHVAHPHKIAKTVLALCRHKPSVNSPKTQQ